MLKNFSYFYPNFKFRYTSTEEIEKIIKSLKTKNVHGYDEISIKILKCSAPFISSPLTYIFNKPLELGSFPSRLKYSTVIPIFKTGDKLNMSSFKPIFSLIFSSQIFKRLFIQEFMHMLFYIRYWQTNNMDSEVAFTLTMPVIH